MQKVIGNPHNIDDIIAPMDLSCHVSHLDSQGSHLGVTIDNFSSLEVCITPSSTVTANWQEGSFLVSTNLISLHPLTNVWGVFAIGSFHKVLGSY